MKFKLMLALTILSLSAIAAFGQTPAPQTAAPKPADVVKLPSAAVVLDKYVKAAGGRAAYEKIKSWKVAGNVEMKPMGVAGTFESISAAPDRAYFKMSMKGIGDIITAFDGEKGWSIDPIAGSRDIEGDELTKFKVGSTIKRDIMFAELYPNIAVKGSEMVGGRDTWVLAGSHGTLPEEKFYFDKESGMLVRTDSVTSSPHGTIPVQAYYEEYQVVDGVKMPHRMRMVTPVYEIVMATTEIKQNVPVADTIFAKPTK